VFAHVFSLILGGLPYLLARWKPRVSVFWTCSSCPLQQGDWILLTQVLSGEVTLVAVVEEVVGEIFPDKYVISKNNDQSTESSDRSLLIENDQKVFRYFFYKYMRYVWNTESMNFQQLHGYDQNTKLSSFFTEPLCSGHSQASSSSLLQLYGCNDITVEVPTYMSLLVQECLHPFYIFQLCSIILWSLDEYLFYAGCIFAISVMSIAVSLYETRRQSESLHEMVSQGGQETVSVVRPGEDEIETANNTDLVPGDIIVIPPNGCTMCCDVVLLTGTAIVNESMLTGESVPVTKACLPHTDGENDENYNPDLHKRHTVFAGTQVIQTRYYGDHRVIAVVVRTGFQTSKGELIRSILYPKPMGFKFYQDSIRFILFLFCIASLGMMYCVYIYVNRGSDIGMILRRTLDIITIVVPPALPAAMTVGTVYAQGRLKKQGIFCISPARINVCGKLKLICFDKTGTLTEDGLDMWGLIPAAGNAFQDVVKNIPTLGEDSQLLWCLASCHSLTTIKGEVTGDPLDMKMFDSTLWQLEEEGGDNQKFDKMVSSVVKAPNKTVDYFQAASAAMDGSDSLSTELGIIRQLTFSSSLARMSVVVRELGSRNFQVFTKGAPERLEELCTAESIPADYHSRLKEMTLAGYRVLALATRTLDRQVNWVQVQKMKRPDLERNLSFLGFLVMQNTLKPQTSSVIEELSRAATRSVMVTGDNILTAISVARDCGMVGRSDRVVEAEGFYDNDRAVLKFSDADGETEQVVEEPPESAVIRSDFVVFLEQTSHLAITGKTWEVVKKHFPEIFSKLLLRCTVFARMAPDQKAALVESLQELGYVTAMCGDGANDCGALKAAHVGISLSEAEASVAAPFTSKIPNISCIPTLMKEGRCALVTSFGVFKYMALYSFIQFISVLILYTNKTNLGDTQFLYIDLVITTTVAVLMGRTAAWDHLVATRPPGSLVSGPTLFSILLQILVSLAGQLAAIFFLQTRSWYNPVEINSPNEEVILCWDTTTIFLVSSYQYLSLATVFSRGPPYRRPFYTNVLYLVALVLLTSFTTLLLLYPPPALAKFFELMIGENGPSTHTNYRLYIGILIIVNICVNFLVELSVSSGRWVKSLSHCLTRKKRPKNKYKLVKKALEEFDHDWPRNGATYYSSIS